MKKTVIAALLALTSASAFAADFSLADASVDNVYAGIDAGRSDFRNFGPVGTNDFGNSYGAYVGYQFHPNLSAEVGYRQLGNYSAPATTGHASAWDFSLVGRYPVVSGLSLTGKIGLAAEEAKYAGATKDQTNPVIGVGAEYALTNNVSVTGGVDRYTNFAGTAQSLDDVSFGLKYRF